MCNSTVVLHLKRRSSYILFFEKEYVKESADLTLNDWFF
ncbi:hypothetical protein LEP1GSC068_3586 [Leptospira sp. Fiocruz LV3954]|nr:hypothetical protein LEP1GSC068_3586 [Leptospira sp. Fiocruz LV3954]EMI69852.1 hypothetical protein LEP1GSC076_2430 [Leptospira sp. Fiocruz LV4135]